MRQRAFSVFVLFALRVVPGAFSHTSLDDKPPDSARSLKSLGERYGLEIVFESTTLPVETVHGPIGGAEATPAEIERYSPILVGEWSLYPRSLVRRSGLKRIVLCKDLSFAAQKRAAVPDFEHDAYYLDVVRGRHDRRYERTVIHHDYFHLIDWRDDGELYSDAAWAKLNHEGFKYGNGGVNAQDDPSVGVDTSETPGFLNRYAMTGVEEDKAEVFAHLMAEPVALEKRCQNDEVLTAKVKRMKSLLAAFCSEMDDAYWNTLRQADAQRGKVDHNRLDQPKR